MKSRKLFSLAMVGVILLALVGCKSNAPSSSAAAAKDYSQVIHDARTDEYNEAYSILSPDKTGNATYALIDGHSADMDADGIAAQADMALQMLNLSAADMQDYALSISLMNIKSYAVAVIKPADGKADTVKKGLQDYVDMQKKNMETYLPDQYEIAKDAKVVVTSGGEVVLVCCENADTVLSSIENALKA
jgi:hypothetical protein